MKPETEIEAETGAGTEAGTGIETERLAWLEEAMRIAHAPGALAAARRKPVPGDRG